MAHIMLDLFTRILNLVLTKKSRLARISPLSIFHHRGNNVAQNTTFAEVTPSRDEPVNPARAS